MELAAAESQNVADMEQDDEDDADYYRKEVGAEPEKGNYDSTATALCYRKNSKGT